MNKTSENMEGKNFMDPTEYINVCSVFSLLFNISFCNKYPWREIGLSSEGPSSSMLSPDIG